MIRFLQSGNKAVKYILGALLTVICLSMVVYLIPGLSSDIDFRQRGTEVASVGDEKISAEDVTHRVEQMQRRQQQPLPDFLRPYLTDQATKQLVQQAELMYEARRMGFTATDDEVRAELRDGPYKTLFFPNGQWIGQKQYEDMLTSNNMSTTQFEEQERFEVLKDKLVSAVTAGVDVPPTEIERQYRNDKLKVKFDYVMVDAGELEKKITATDTELKSFFADGRAYQNAIPEKRVVNYFVLGRQTAENQVTVTSEDVESYYKTNQQNYSVPDKAKVRLIQINVPPAGADGKVDAKGTEAARSKANDLLKQIRGGADFAELAKKNSDDKTSAEKGGELPTTERGQFPYPDFDKAAFALSNGQTGEVLQTPAGFDIIQMIDKQEGKIKPLSEVRADIEKGLKKQKADAAVQQFNSAALADAQTMGIDKAAAKYGVTPVHSNPVTKKDILPGIGPAPETMNVIFSTPANSAVRPAGASSGTAFVKVEKIVPARTPTFEEYKDHIVKDFKSERASTLMNGKVQELVNKARISKDLGKTAKELGLAVKSSELVDRTGSVPDLGAMNGPPSVAFNMKVGEVSTPVSLPRKTAVLEVTAVQDPPLDGDFAKAKDGIRDQLINSKRQQAMEQFMAALDARLQKDGKVKMVKAEATKGPRPF